MKLKNNVAIVTGGANGIGKAVALEFVKQGAKVVVCDIDEVAGKKLIKQIKQLGYQAIFVHSNINKDKDIEKIINITLKKFKKINILVNNAGILIEKKLEDIKNEDWNEIVDINLKGMFFFISKIAKYMKKNKKGKIISISSIFGNAGYDKYSLYSAVNGGVISLTKSVAIELAPYKINVNTVSPGIIATNMNQKTLSNPKLKKEIISNIPLKRIGSPEEVADAVVFLASNRSDFITGHNLIIDGGWLAH